MNPVVVGLHHITWRATASGVADETVVADALAWLVGDPELVDIEPTTSYHGSKLHMVTGVCKKKAHALKSLSRIGKECLQTLLDEVEVRFDENHTMYFRLDLDAFIGGEVVLANRVKLQPSNATRKSKYILVKMRLKNVKMCSNSP